MMPRVVTCGRAVLLALSLAAGGAARAQAPDVVQDFYYHGGGEVRIAIHLDSIAVLPVPGADTALIDAALGSAGAGFSFARTLPEGLRLYGTARRLSRAGIFDLGRSLRVGHPTSIQMAGPLTRRLEGGRPFVATDQLIVQFRPEVTLATIDSLDAVYGTHVAYRSPFLVKHFLLQIDSRAPPDGVALTHTYHGLGAVASVYPGFLGGAAPTAVLPDDPLFPDQWHLRNTGQSGGTPGADIKATDAWSTTFGDPSVVVAVIELTGFEVAHVDLFGNFWHNAAETADNGIDDDGNGMPDDVDGWNFGSCAAPDPVTNTAATAQTCGGPDVATNPRVHATAVAGLIAAAVDNDTGVVGVCPGCRVLPIVTGSSWYGKVLAFAYAASMGASLINASWTMTAYGPVETAVVKAANAGAYGTPVVFAMDNVNADECTGADRTLAALPEVIAVGASDNRDVRVPESGWGPCLALLAPAAIAGSQWGETSTDLSGEGGYNFKDRLATAPCPVVDVTDLAFTKCFGGTSAAAPLVSGVIGLLRSVNPSLPRDMVKEILENTADKIDPAGAGYGPGGFSQTYGYGRLNAAAALDAAAPKWSAPKTVLWAVAIILLLIVLRLPRRVRQPKPPLPRPPTAAS